MATFVLVHGGGHGGWCFAKVTERLQARGHRVHAPSLTGLGERSHLLSREIDLDTHITDIVQLLHYEDVHDAIVVGHSYGGMVITGVGDRAPGRVGKLVYLDAANPRDGQSLVDVAGPIILATRDHAEFRDGIELVLVPAEGSGAFYGVTDPVDLAWMDERLTPHPWACFEQPLRLIDPGRLATMPTYHVVCESTIESRGADVIEAARADGRLWSIDTGHDLMITEPDFVADTLTAIAAR